MCTRKHNLCLSVTQMLSRRHTITLPLYLCLPVMSLRVSLEALGINADGGTHPSAAPAHPKHQAGRVSKDDSQTLKTDKPLCQRSPVHCHDNGEFL